ncbi:uncharacterized protein LOC126377842 [Pectinophora gossypiella]|uniref:uncharacterized protein LOC126377842 n=1 Tax=Pectinophora gossypiella TaxID=13191 RepID=UPI00214F3C3C|nr:uncharacterized protein LOC126377842 [Pectinophora gossypiella]
MSESNPRKKRGSTWDEDSLRRAMEAVQNNELNTNAAALKFNIPRRTLRNHLLSGNRTKIIGKTTILTKQLEEDLSQRIIRFAKLGLPLTPKFIRKQAFLFCERFKIKHSFNMSTRMAGRKWLKMFLSRNPSISKRKPQLMNPARAQKMNKPIVKHHFEEVKKLYEELDIIAHPERLYNMDEKGCRITVHKQNVVLAEKGNKRVHLVAPEHAENVTIAMCVNAVGIAIPPMIIFKGIRYRSELASNLPPGTKVSMAPKGSMTSSLFVEFIQHLAQHKVPGNCLLIFDGAKCHLSYEALEEADKHNIVLYCLPSNTTHELQPLDKSVNRSFEHHWDEEVLNYLCNSQERTLNKASFSKIFSRTWPKCMTQSNIANGFKATGLYPLDPDVIPEDAYAPSIVTERPLSEALQHQIDQPIQVSPPMTEFQKVSELSSRPLIDERSTRVSDVSSISPSIFKENKVSTSPKILAATPKTKPVLVSYSFSTDDSDLELDITVKEQCRDMLLSSIQVDTVADTKRDPRPSLYDNSLPSTSGLQQNIVYSSSESDLDLNLNESFIKDNYMPKLRVSDLYTSSSFDDSDLEQKGEITPKKQLQQNKSTIKTKAQLKSHETKSSDDDEPLINLIKDKKESFHAFLPTPNYATIKSTRPRQKAINYKGQRIVKDLFKTEDKENKMKQVTSKKKGKSTIKKDQRKKTKNKNDSVKRLKRIGQKQNSKRSRIEKKKSKGEEKEWYCHACGKCKMEDMRQCTECQKWYHETCVGLTKKDLVFICPDCD